MIIVYSMTCRVSFDDNKKDYILRLIGRDHDLELRDLFVFED